MDGVVGFAFGGGPAKLTSEHRDPLGADRAPCPGKVNLGAGSSRSSMEGYLHAGLG